MLSSAEALAQLTLLYQRHLVHFSHLVLCDICLADTFVSFVGLSLYLYIASYEADVVAVIAMRQLSAAHSTAAAAAASSHLIMTLS